MLAYDAETDATGYYTVTAILVHDDPIIVHLTLDGEQIETTPEHPFYTEEDGWVDAAALRAGDHVRRADGAYGVVQAVEVEQTPQVMYNLTVAGAHTFFVGQGEWLVHNTNCADDLRYLVNGEWGPNPADVPVKFGYTDDLKKYVGKIPGVSYLTDEWWLKGGLVSWQANSMSWQAEALEAMENSKTINFIVDRMSIFDFPDSYKLPLATHWEMDQIIKRGYIDKLHLWMNGKELSAPETLRWLERWKDIRGLP